jgi:hypothetical protein
MPAAGDHPQLRIGQGALEPQVHVQHGFVLVADHEERGHLHRREFGAEVEQRRTQRLVVAQGQRRALGRVLEQVAGELGMTPRILAQQRQPRGVAGVVVDQRLHALALQGLCRGDGCVPEAGLFALHGS